jgi:hypothetical protein
MIETLKNIANIIFFVVVATVTVLSYRQARKTLFAPIRTETFKLQLKAFEEVLLYFQNKSEADFLESFDLDRIVSLNALRMADEYVAVFFRNEIKVDKEEREKLYRVFIGGIVSTEHMKKHFEKEEPTAKEMPDQSSQESITNPAIVLARWQEYDHGMVEYTKEFQDQLKELEKLAASPLLPKSLREMIGEFHGKAHKNLELTGKVVGSFAHEMPKHFPRAGDMRKFNPGGIWNSFNDQREEFEPAAKNILDNINKYLKVEDLMKGST